MMPILDYTFDFTKDPPYENIIKKYFIEWIWVGEHNEKYVIEIKDFDTFEEARDYNVNSNEDGIGWLYRNRRFK